LCHNRSHDLPIDDNPLGNVIRTIYSTDIHTIGWQSTIAGGGVLLGRVLYDDLVQCLVDLGGLLWTEYGDIHGM
jgi:hypothetical protein